MVLSIIADDLTGACDSGTLFAGAGPVSVAVWPRLTAAGPVRVIDTESRAVTAGEAAGRVAATARGRGRGGRHFKKIDSTLRGHVGSEVTALLRALGGTSAVLTPAFPARGRTVLDRSLFVDGVPITETTRLGAPAFPAAATANVVEFLRPTLDFPLAWIPIDQVRAGVEPLTARLRRLSGTVAIADAETDDDLALLVDAALAVEPSPLLVGAAGLARPLASRLGLAAGPVALPPGGRWLIVAGSRHPVTRRQAAAAQAAGLAVIAAPAGDGDDDPAVAAALAGEAARRLEHEAFDVVAVTGGDTALALYRALDGERLELCGAPEPGLAFGHVRSRRRPPVAVLTKAGGFGGPDLFVTLAREASG